MLRTQFLDATLVIILDCVDRVGGEGYVTAYSLARYTTFSHTYCRSVLEELANVELVSRTEVIHRHDNGKGEPVYKSVYTLSDDGLDYVTEHIFPCQQAVQYILEVKRAKVTIYD